MSVISFGQSIGTASLAVAACVFLSAGTAQAAPLTGNGGFEVAGALGATDSDEWGEFAGGAPGTLSERDSSNPASGQWAHHVVALGSPTAGAAAGITQNSIDVTGGISLDAGTVVSGTFEADLMLGPGGVAFAEFSILNGIGAIVATTGPVALTDTGPGYETYNLSALNVPAFGASPNDTFAAFLNLNVAAGAFDGSVAEAYFDNVSVNGTLVPEPASLALLALGGLAVAGRRRR
ncbi:MAG: PEP-CTERM sorting domain-containing protein [Planctomycetota bacterium]